MELTLENAPLGTRAPATTGGYWKRTDKGWQWNTGATFTNPGGDWNGELILICPMCKQQLRKGEMTCCGIWHEPNPNSRFKSTVTNLQAWKEVQARKRLLERAKQRSKNRNW